MTDDIVTRLRQGDPCCLDGHVYEAWANEAADEIECLRALVEHLSACIDENSHAYGCLGYKFDGWCTCQVRETLKAVRGE